MKEKKYHIINYLCFILIPSAGNAITIDNGEIRELNNNSEVLNLDSLYIKDGGVLIKNGTLETNDAMITKNEGENGNVTITGKDSIWNNTGVLSLGILNDTDYEKKLTSNASITINNGGKVFTDKLTMANYNDVFISAEGKYVLNVDGDGSLLKINNDFLASRYYSNRTPSGTVNINISNGGVVEAENINIHDFDTNNNDVSVNTELNINNNGLLKASGDIYFAKNLGNSDSDTQSKLTVSSGGRIEGRNFYLGMQGGWSQKSTIQTSLSGEGSSINMSDNFYTGGNYRHTLKVEDGAQINAKNIFFGKDGLIPHDSPRSPGDIMPAIIVSGKNAKITAQDELVLGDTFSNDITIIDGGEVRAENINIGNKNTGYYRNLKSYVRLNKNGSLSAQKITLNKNGDFDEAVIFIGDGNGYGKLNAESIEGFSADTYNDRNIRKALLNFNYKDDDDFSSKLINTVNIVKDNVNTITLSGDNSQHSGSVFINDGELKASNEKSFGNIHVVNNSRFNLSGFKQTISSLDNSGTVILSGANQTQTTLNITGNFVSNSGSILFNTELANDDSKTDKLTIKGNSNGSSTVHVNNVNGQGAKTEKGIELITVSGRSDGVFTQDGRIVAGAYDYTLQRGGYTAGTDNKNWYLTSRYV
ncbi:autotransporter outer membrane beta-barrel domain-containing protein, partial [Escherichia coli]|nr:autotransporter outer membrane beta-barrel domain-containing protein [Escherichia coli]ELM8149596.1 autotransporter outer membrane beta-barrel domain-containing protein [Escherichia coli]